MSEHPWLTILRAMWNLSPDATPLQRLLVWRPTTGDGWRFRAMKLRELGVHHASPPRQNADGNPTTTA